MDFKKISYALKQIKGKKYHDLKTEALYKELNNDLASYTLFVLIFLPKENSNSYWKKIVFRIFVN